MRILFIGDIFASVGKRILAEHLQKILAEFSIDCCIANGENIAGGRGITANLAKKLRRFGVDIITGGNHSFAEPAVYSDEQVSKFLLRPLNMIGDYRGNGTLVHTLADGRKIAVVNLMGITFMDDEKVASPFAIGAEAIDRALDETKIVLVDFHAEATSEKVCFAHLVDGRASAVLGTHTHVQTADERILPNGTAFITDAGMTGPESSAIGMRHEPIIRKFLTGEQVRFEPSDKGPMFNGVVVEIDDESGRAKTIARIYRRYPYLT